MPSLETTFPHTSHPSSEQPTSAATGGKNKIIPTDFLLLLKIIKISLLCNRTRVWKNYKPDIAFCLVTIFFFNHGLPRQPGANNKGGPPVATQKRVFFFPFLFSHLCINFTEENKKKSDDIWRILTSGPEKNKELIDITYGACCRRGRWKECFSSLL